MKLHMRTHAIEMPPAGHEPATLAHAAQAATQLTKMTNRGRQAGRAGQSGGPTKMK